jgi:hypothetical protein
MKNQTKWILPFICSLAIGMLTGCDQAESNLPIAGLDTPLEVDEVQVQIIDAQLLTSYSVHYIMHYPDDGQTFTALTAQIEGAETPQAALDWGTQNIYLTRAARNLELTYAHWELVGDEIEYRSGEDFQYQYIFIFSAPEHSDYTKSAVRISGGLVIPLERYWTSLAPVTPNTRSAMTPSTELYTALGGGSQNVSSAYHTTISGGHLNQASMAYAAVSGGRENLATNAYSTVGGGYANAASGRDATVGGGSRNLASNYHATIAGGIRNQATASDTTISGGGYNQATDIYATVGGGTQNEARGSGSVVSGGAGNLAGDNQSAVGGGLNNQATGIYATIAGGQGNIASGGYSSIPGGFQNQTLGDYSMATGHRAVVAANHPGTFLYADATAANFDSLQANEFGVRATGGVRFISGVDVVGNPISGVVLLSGSGSWSTLSDRRLKKNIKTIDPLQILAAVASLPIGEWSYITQDPNIRHVGPMAQDFYAAFGTGADSRHISSVDADGVALAAIQGLHQLVVDQETTIEVLEARLTAIERRAELWAGAVILALGFFGWNSRYNRNANPKL